MYAGMFANECYAYISNWRTDVEYAVPGLSSSRAGSNDGMGYELHQTFKLVIMHTSYTSVGGRN